MTTTNTKDQMSIRINYHEGTIINGKTLFSGQVFSQCDFVSAIGVLIRLQQAQDLDLGFKTYTKASFDVCGIENIQTSIYGDDTGQGVLDRLLSAAGVDEDLVPHVWL